MSQPLSFSIVPPPSLLSKKKHFATCSAPFTRSFFLGLLLVLQEGSGYLAALYNTGDMAVRIEMQNTGNPRVRGEIVAILEHVLSDWPGEWRVSIVGSHANDHWEMKVGGRRASSARTLGLAPQASTSRRR
jgi:hypothetical protein